MTSLDAATACANSMTPGAKLDALIASLAQFPLADAAYLPRGNAGELYLVPATDRISNPILGADAQSLYKNVFAKNVEPRAIYDAIKHAASEVCPLCDHRIVASLDHYLCQSRHARFVITPANLVPACSDCNKAKSAYQPANEQEQLFHPYFDNFDGEQWLFATVEMQSPLALRYFVLGPSSWTDSKVARAKKHFEVFQLATLYAVSSASEMADIQGYLKDLHDVAGALGVKQYLDARAASSRRRRINSWKHAAYMAWANSPEFCDGGFAT